MRKNQMIPFFRRALKDMRNNGFIHTVSIITIAFSVFIVSAFLLFFINVEHVVSSWQKEVRLLVYLEKNTSGTGILDAKQRIGGLKGIREVLFIPKQQALDEMKQRMKRQGALFENLKDNPLPDTFEVYTKISDAGWGVTERLAREIEGMEGVESVEYGQKWLVKFQVFSRVFRFVGFTLGSMFFVVTVFIIANTIRLALYSRREEVEIMSIVGATESFIKIPFYMEGLMLGALGGLVGLVMLFAAFLFVSTNIDPGLADRLVRFQFLARDDLLAVFLSSTLVGWLGCYISLKQFLKI